MGTEDYRKLARNCIEWYHEASDPEVKESMYLMAKRFMARALQLELHGSDESITT